MNAPDRPGASTPEETEHANRQPGPKGHPAEGGPASEPSKETGVGGPPPDNNSAPGTRSTEKPATGPDRSDRSNR